MYVCGGGEVKRKGEGYVDGVEKNKERIKKKEMRRCDMWVVGGKRKEKRNGEGEGEGVYCGKKVEGKRKKRKN